MRQLIKQVKDDQKQPRQHPGQAKTQESKSVTKQNTKTPGKIIRKSEAWQKTKKKTHQIF